MDTSAIIIIIIVGIILLLVFYGIGVYNKLVNARNKVNDQFAQIDVQLKRRVDLIPNLVETVKGYAKHEEKTLKEVIEARNKMTTANGINEELEASNQVTAALNKLFALSEAYPDLKANTNFLDLQDQLKGVENDIANSRKYYNAVVKQFNTKCEMFPSNIIAGICHFEKKTMFEVDSAEERKNVEVKF